MSSAEVVEFLKSPAQSQVERLAQALKATNLDKFIALGKVYLTANNKPGQAPPKVNIGPVVDAIHTVLQEENTSHSCVAICFDVLRLMHGAQPDAKVWAIEDGILKAAVDALVDFGDEEPVLRSAMGLFQETVGHPATKKATLEAGVVTAFLELIAVYDNKLDWSGGEPNDESQGDFEHSTSMGSCTNSDVVEQIKEDIRMFLLRLWTHRSDGNPIIDSLDIPHCPKEATPKDGKALRVSEEVERMKMTRQTPQHMTPQLQAQLNAAMVIPVVPAQQQQQQQQQQSITSARGQPLSSRGTRNPPAVASKGTRSNSAAPAKPPARNAPPQSKPPQSNPQQPNMPPPSNMPAPNNMPPQNSTPQQPATANMPPPNAAATPAENNNPPPPKQPEKPQKQPKVPPHIQKEFEIKKKAIYWAREVSDSLKPGEPFPEPSIGPVFKTKEEVAIAKKAILESRSQALKQVEKEVMKEESYVSPLKRGALPKKVDWNNLNATTDAEKEVQKSRMRKQTVQLIGEMQTRQAREIERVREKRDKEKAAMMQMPLGWERQNADADNGESTLGQTFAGSNADRHQWEKGQLERTPRRRSRAHHQ